MHVLAPELPFFHRLANAGVMGGEWRTESLLCENGWDMGRLGQPMAVKLLLANKAGLL